MSVTFTPTWSIAFGFSISQPEDPALLAERLDVGAPLAEGADFDHHEGRPPGLAYIADVR